MAFYAFRTQLFPSAPSFTEKDVPNLKGKVYLVTGSNTGIGFELVKILYAAQARVYMASRTESKALEAIASIKQTVKTTTPGEIRYLHLDLADLSTIKATVAAFASQETELHVLWNNAGIGMVPATLSPQGHDIYMATMCLGPFLLTHLLLPYLRRAAASPSSPTASVRVTWTSSRLMDTDAPPDGLVLSELTSPTQDLRRLYGASKAGNYYISSLLAPRVQKDGIVSLTVNPGNVRTQMYDNAPKWLIAALGFLIYDVVYGAYTNAWAGLSDEIGMADSGRYVIPWGRWHPKIRGDIEGALKGKEDGGSGVASAFWEWCEQETKEFL